MGLRLQQLRSSKGLHWPAEWGLSPEPLEGARPCWHLAVWLPGSRTVRG